VDGQRARSVIEAKSRALNIPVENIIAEKTAGTALGRFVTEAEVAHVAVFLASPYASGITGQNITVDAGSIHR
jgi:enoyl-[acyl-carrier-protein] reductase (NADH)